MSRSVLVVEDNPADSDLARELLAADPRTRYDVDDASRLAEAVSRLRHKRYDVVILDLNLPDGAGLDCLRQVLAAAGEAAVVVLTGADDEELGLACVAQGAEDYLWKSHVSAPALLRSVGYAISRHREARLLQAQKMEAVGHLAGGIAHDFNNLITIILNYGEFLKEDLAADDARREDLLQILHAADRARALIAQLLAFARRRPVEPRRLDLAELIARVEPLLRRTLRENITLETDLAPDLWATTMDPSQLEQILINLAVNSSDAMPNGGAIRIALANRSVDIATPGLLPGAYVRIQFRDTGAGIPAEVLGRIFEPFFTTKDVGKGTGLGLATCYGIARQAGGAILVESTVGQGTEFSVFLPRADAASLAPQRAIAPPNRSLEGSEAILVVEDDEGLRRSMTRVLTRYGYTVLPARDGEEAMAFLLESGTRIDMVVTDMVMPRMGGRELLNFLHARRPDLRLLCVTGHALGPGGTGGELHPVAEVLFKPFEPNDLLRHIRKVLDAPPPSPG